MLLRALRAAVTTLRAAGWRAFLLTYAYLVPIAVMLPRPDLVLIIGMALLNIVTFAIIRNLAAIGPSQAPALPEPVPVVPEDGLPPVRRPLPGPAGPADRNPRHALRQAARLSRPALRLALIQLTGYVAVALLFVMVGGDKLVMDERLTHSEQLVLAAGVTPLIGLVQGFLAVAAQRIAIEGDQRVLVAVWHSIRVARTAYGPMFALSLAEPLLLVAEIAVGPSVAVSVFAAVAHPLLRLFVIAALNQVYAEGPRFDVPAAPAPGRPGR